MSIDQNSTTEPTQSRRFGNRADIDQPATLTVDGTSIEGVISNVGLRGAFFAAEELPKVGATGMLQREGARGVEVWVVWHKEGAESGVGLSFDGPQ